MIQVRIGYFAVFRETAAKNEELIETSAKTAADLYHELKARYQFNLSLNQVKIAINDQFKSGETQLKHGDYVVFIAPIAGG